MLHGRIYRVLEVFTNLAYLNFLWLVACVPVVTVPASTTAMFGVVRDWERGNEPSVARRFVSLFREDFRQSSLVGAVWALIGATLAADFYLVGQMDFLRVPLYVALFGLVFLYASASVYLFPVMVNYDASWGNVLKNALLFPLAAPLTAVQCLLVVGVAAFITVSLPLTILISGSATAYAVYFLCEKSFRRIDSLKSSDEREPENQKGKEAP